MNKHTANPMIKAAFAYLRLGLSVIPLCFTDSKGKCQLHGSSCRSPGKTPLFSWKKYQTQKPTLHDINTWWRKWPRANLGIITGAISNLVVLDIDSHAAEKHIKQMGVPDTAAALTGSGRHLYFQHPGQSVPNAINLIEGLDIRGDGGYVAAPPSVHASGRCYCWENAGSRPDWKLSPLPEWIRKKLIPGSVPSPAKIKTGPHWFIQAFRSGCEKGSRNDTCARMAGYLLRYLPDPNVAAVILQEWNLRNSPPLNSSEVRKTVCSIHRTTKRRGDETFKRSVK